VRVGPAQVKVCCIRNEAELILAYEAGVRFAGLVGPMPSGPGTISEEAITWIAAQAPPDMTTVLLTAREDAASIVAHVLGTGAKAVQIVRPVAPEIRLGVRRALGGTTILQVVHVEGRDSVEEARVAAVGADYLLLDSGRPSAAVAELGGTGRTHDWSLSARIVEGAPVPVFLAGGLDPDNVSDAVEAVRPYGVDVCSGLRTPYGRLDPERLKDFMERLGER
jgi:phosphoribosylanthranilate isomerase